MTQADPTNETSTSGIPQTRILEALENSAKEVAELRGILAGMGVNVSNLETSLNEKMSRLEGVVSNTNAHLDNLTREVNKTNTLLENDIKVRREARERKEKEEEAEKKRLQAIADDNRETVKKAFKELWAMFKQPLGFLTAGAVAWFVYQYMSVPENTRLPLPPDHAPKEIVGPREEP